MNEVKEYIRWIGLTIETLDILRTILIDDSQIIVNAIADDTCARLGYYVNMQAHGQTDHTKNTEQLT